MSIITELSNYLEAKKAYDEYEPDDQSYSPWKQRLHDRLADTEQDLARALDQLIADRIESATGARP